MKMSLGLFFLPLVCSNAFAITSDVTLLDAIGLNQQSLHGNSNLVQVASFFSRAGIEPLPLPRLSKLKLESTTVLNTNTKTFVFSDSANADPVGDYDVVFLDIDSTNPSDPIVFGGRAEISDD